MSRSRNWKDEYVGRRALWIHDGNAARPHAELTSGKHSSGFFNSERVLEDPSLLEDAVLELFSKLLSLGIVPYEVDRVIGPAMGAITLAHDMARVIGRYSMRTCLRAYVEKTPDGVNFEFRRTSLAAGERVLVVEDVLTTGASTFKTIHTISLVGGEVHPYIIVLVNRTGREELNGMKIVSLINEHMPIWETHECPLCKRGSKALRPKEIQNWQLLNAEY